MTASINIQSPTLEIHDLGLQDYEPVWQQMLDYTLSRNEQSADMIWRLQHHPVLTLGYNGKAEHILAPTDIPVIKVDRGGQVTYHGPGQLVVYLMLDLKRRNLGIKDLVIRLEQAVIRLLATYQVEAHTIPGAPGVYVDGAKIAALGLRVRKQGCYHGLSLNIDMDLEPFSLINPCGYQDMKVTQLVDLTGPVDFNRVSAQLTDILVNELD